MVRTAADAAQALALPGETFGHRHAYPAGRAVSLSHRYSARPAFSLVPMLLTCVLFFGSALAIIGDRAQIIHDMVDQVSKVFFHIVHVITKVAPIGAFGAMAFTIGKYGLG